MKRIKQIKENKLNEILEELDSELVISRVNHVPDCKALREAIDQYVNPDKFSTTAVLGIDIYKYSRYNSLEQSLIPFVFKTIFDWTLRLCQEHEFIFQKHSSADIKKKFISTGDGGFLLFDTPLHALLFACNFELANRLYSSYHIHPRLRQITGEISLRYSITYDNIYGFEGNYYGPAIINNARILAKDKLNRCLIESNVYSWFMLNIDGIENLQILDEESFAHVQEFSEYDKDKIGEDAWFRDVKDRGRGIINSDVQKIGSIKSKDTELDVYNLHLQVANNIRGVSSEGKKSRRITISLGNLNTTGISDD